MGGDDKDGYYCTICGGIPPDRITTRRILVDGKETGIEQLDRIIAEVKKLNLSGDTVITGELLRRTKALNYVPSKKAREYGEALLGENNNPGGNRRLTTVPVLRTREPPRSIKNVPGVRVFVQKLALHSSR
jgi:hypothetical protein